MKVPKGSRKIRISTIKILIIHLLEKISGGGDLFGKKLGN